MNESKPPITGTMQTLPFDKLSPNDFERLCLWLVEREGYERVEHPGAAGSDQGCDIVAWRKGQLWVFQCKRVQRFGPASALKEVEKILALREDERPHGLLFLVTCNVRGETRRQARERCAREEIKCEFWTGTELDEKVKRHPDILEEFFRPATLSWWDRFRQQPLVFYPTLALAILLAIVLLMSGLISMGANIGGARQQLQKWGRIRAFPSASEDEILIVIASFHHSEGVPDTEIHNEIRRAIQEAAEEVNFSNLRVEVEPTRLAADDQARAEKLGQRYNASIVIWGADTGVRVAVSYLNLKQPDLDAAEVKISETERTQLINPSAYASLVTQDLPGQLTFLSLFAIGQSYYIEGNYEEAIAVIKAAVNSLASGGNLPEGVAEAHFRLGWLYQGQMLDDEQAIAAYSNRAFAYFFQSFSDFDQNDVNAAFADFEKVIELAPDSARAYESRGMMRIAQIVAQSYPSTAILSPDILDAALADLGRAIELDPDYVSPYVNRGDVYYLMGNSDAALANFNRAIELDPDNADVYQRRGNVHRSLDELDDALADFDKAIELDLDNVAAYYDRGLVHFEQDDLDAAIADFSEGITLESELSALYDDQGTERRSLSNLDEITYRLHVQWGFSGLTLEEAYYTRGSCLGIQGKLSKAIADFNEAIRLNPNYAEAYSNRGAVRYQQGKLVSALADFNKAIELDRDYAETYWRRGVALQRFSEPDEALADFRTYLELRPNADNRAQIEEWIAELEIELSDK
jgi:tetratricopeptide (TPR) repeat protein